MFAVYFFAQSAIAIVGGSDLSRVVLYAAGLIVVGVMGWVVKVTRDVSRAITRLTDYLFGFTGDNGLNSQVTRLRDDVDDLMRDSK